MDDELGLWWLDGDGTEEDLFAPEWDDDEELGNIFGDIVKGVSKVVTAPVDIVASVLPKPLKKPFQAISSIAGPTHMAARAVQGKGPLGMKLGGSVGGRVRTRTRRRPTTRKPTYRRTSRPKLSLSKVASAGVGSGRDDLLKAMIGVLGAKDMVKVAANARGPRLAAKSTGKDKGAGAQQLADMYARAVAKKLGPDLSAINKKLQLAENQRLATSEHLNINNTAAFRRKVLQDLMRMSTCLPSNHPTRAKIRRIGLMSGLL